MQYRIKPFNSVYVFGIQFSLLPIVSYSIGKVDVSSYEVLHLLFLNVRAELPHDADVVQVSPFPHAEKQVERPSLQNDDNPRPSRYVVPHSLVP